ncbi:MAG: DUF2065 domain-containing protein [Desulfovibrionaceae bacterium]|jgi:uncharacterized protein YjeT (DUF2065 family)
MKLDWSLLLTALGLAFVLEGLPYFLWAERMPKVLLMLAQRKSSSLRQLGLSAIILGVLIVFLAKSL